MPTLPVIIERLAQTRHELGLLLNDLRSMTDGMVSGGLIGPGTPLSAVRETTTPYSSAGRSSPLGPTSLASLRSSEAIVAVLRAVGKPLQTRGVVQYLMAHGFHMQSTNPSASMRSTLLRLEKAGVVDRINGAWRLLQQDWTPTPKEGGYHAFIIDRLREGFSMPEAASAWRALQDHAGKGKAKARAK